MDVSKPRLKKIKPEPKPKQVKSLIPDGFDVERTMSVGELVKELKKYDDSTPVVSNGWIVGIVEEKCRVEVGGGYNVKAVRIEYVL